jgi:MYXO-CTERM domain-containing protein
MNHSSSLYTSVLAGSALAMLMPFHATAAVIVRQVGGDATPASITAMRDTFRADLGGGSTAAANGSFGGLRREINWDGVPAAASAPNNLAANFFNLNSPRGAVFSTPGTGFQVSSATTDAGAGQPAAANFGNINAAYTTTFSVFTAQRLFTVVGSNVMDVNFFVPGTNTSATVTGFGAVFTDVDTVGSTRMEFFNELNVSFSVQNVPVGTVANGSLSFLGLFGNAGEKISRVRITTGNAALAGGVSDGGATDLVAMDDFIYSEPVPEPGVLWLGAAGLLGLLRMRRR